MRTRNPTPPVIPARCAAGRGACVRAIVLALAAVSAGSAAGGGAAAQAGPVTPDDGRHAGGQGERAPVVLITGSTDGLGAEVARRMAARGAHVIVHGRNLERGRAVVAEIERQGTGSAAFFPADLADLAAVRALADAILRDYDRLDVLVNNAGIWLNDTERRVSADGHELHFAVNYLAGFVLTRRLLPLLERSAPARIVNVASGAQQPVDFDDVMIERGYTGGRAYARSKLAQVMFTLDLADELEGTGVTAVALHPASLMDTPMVRAAGVRPRSSVAEGADAVINAITSPGLRSGEYLNGLEPARAHRQAYDLDARDRLRRLSARLADG
jgi:NAD(P)-dependent dehydrogenase (short-subunit alcohol dehydrogenase family)